MGCIDWWYQVQGLEEPKWAGGAEPAQEELGARGTGLGWTGPGFIFQAEEERQKKKKKKKSLLHAAQHMAHFAANQRTAGEAG